MKILKCTNVCCAGIEYNNKQHEILSIEFVEKAQLWLIFEAYLGLYSRTLKEAVLTFDT